jgi:hypothetical protein
MQVVEYGDVESALWREPQPRLVLRPCDSGQDGYRPQDLAAHDCREDRDGDGGEHEECEAVRPSPAMALPPTESRIYIISIGQPNSAPRLPVGI